MIPGNANPLLLASAAAAAAGDSNRSLRFNSDDSSSLSKTFSSAGNRKTWTWSAWVKRSGLGDYNFLFHAQTSSSLKAALSFWNSDILKFKTDSSGGEYTVDTDAVFRDPSAWYHIVLRFDTTQSTAADRIRIYVNGVQQTSSSATYPNQNTDHEVNNSCEHLLGSQSGAPENGLDGYMTDVYFIDGVSLGPASFGAYDSDGVWQKADYSGTFGTNGFHLLDFANESTIGADSSGNNNDFTANNLSDTAGAGNDVLLDYPANGDSDNDSGAGGQVNGNYCVFNALNKGNDVTLSNGNLQAACTSSSKDGVFGTIGVSSGKWYWEVELTSSDSNTNAAIGIATSVLSPDAGSPTSAGAYFYSSFNGNKWLNSADSSYGASYGTGDVIGVALDLDNDTLTFYKNGSTQGDATTSLPSGTYFPYVGDGANNSAQTVVANWGQRSFSHSAPSGYKSLCTTNLPTPTIADGSDYFDSKLFSGNGSSQTISGLEFSPDLVWIKSRSNAFNHRLVDQVQGNTSTLASNLTTQAVNCSSDFTGFTSDGFSLTQTASFELNNSSATYVAWAWDAGSSTVSNTDGSGLSNVQVRANTTAGISIVTYTGGSSSPANSDSGDSFGHGLGVAPDLVICKKRTGVNSWPVYHRAAPTGALILNATNANDSSSFLFAKKDPTSTEVFLGNNPEINNSSHNYVAYCFAPVAGYSAFGSYDGNGSSTDGPFAFVGFRIAWLLIKDATSTGAWLIWDVARQTFNAQGPYLLADTADAESDSDLVDFLSNGFKIRTTAGSMNSSGQTYIYAAFAENPFQANGGLAR